MLSVLALILAAQTSTSTPTVYRTDLAPPPIQSVALKTEHNLGFALMAIGVGAAVWGPVSAALQDDRASAGPGGISAVGVVLVVAGYFLREHALESGYDDGG